MPELPEVEIAARSLAPQVQGKQIAGVTRLDWPKVVLPLPPEQFAAQISGRTVVAVGRRAKWIVLTLDDAQILAVHLRMSGKLLFQSDWTTIRHHAHLVLELAQGGWLAFDDERKFGRALLLDQASFAALSAAHGPEPLSEAFGSAELAAIVARRPTKIKPLLLDQRLIAGIGNIYASEALWLAQIHPLRAAHSLSEAEIVALHGAIRHVLEKAIANQGSTLRNYRDGYGQKGSNQDYFFAYDRADQPCQRCGSAIERSVIAQRSTYFCPTCQPSPYV